MPLTKDTSELDDGLHALDFPLDDLVEVLLLDIREEQEVHRTSITSRGILGDEFS